MMTTAAVYDAFVGQFVRGQVDWGNDPMKVMLADSSYQPDQWKDKSAADVPETDASSGYVRGGELLGDCRVEGSFPDPVRLVGGSVVWEDFSGSFRYAVVYRPDDGLLVGYTDLGYQRLQGASVTVGYGPDGGICEFSIIPASAETLG